MAMRFFSILMQVFFIASPAMPASRYEQVEFTVFEYYNHAGTTDIESCFNMISEMVTGLPDTLFADPFAGLFTSSFDSFSSNKGSIPTNTVPLDDITSERWWQLLPPDARIEDFRVHVSCFTVESEQSIYVAVVSEYFKTNTEDQMISSRGVVAGQTIATDLAAGFGPGWRGTRYFCSVYENSEFWGVGDQAYPDEYAGEDPDCK